MKKYLALYRMAFQDVFSDPGKPVVWLMVGAAFCFCSAFIWIVVANGSNKVGALPLSDIVTYYLFLFVFWYVIGGMFSMIMENTIYRGKLSSELLKPVFPFARCIVWEQGWKTFNVILAVPMLGLFGFLFRDYLDFSVTLPAVLAALPAILLAFFLFILFDFCLGCITFWSNSLEGLYNLLWPIRNVFGGWLAPVALLPGTLHTIAVFLPFRYFFNFPVELLKNQLIRGEIILGYGIELVWVLLLFVTAVFLYKAGLKRYEASGN